MHTPPILAFDFLDPWGWVALRRLAIAMAMAGKDFKVTFQPCRSAQGQTATGTAYTEFLALRFGTHAVVHQSLVAAQMQKLGVEPAFSEIRSVPDTRPALATVLWLQHSARPAQAFVQRVFEALYCEGQDIGDEAVLQRLLSQETVSFGELKAFMHSDAFSEALQRSENAVSGWAGRVIPSLRIEGTVVFGAQPPGILARMFA
ncbi:DsbA family protein [Pseudomonas sp. TWI628]|uniref:DsbA family oxidoreductase n=1 Tax=Pseudomonas sp. TWI628 TaxID=3136788 RepID=UPI00320AB9AE